MNIEGDGFMQVEWIDQLTVGESFTLMAPILFIFLHVIRPVTFLPVLVICVTGGILFGPLAGTIYSIVGLTFSSMIFYLFIRSIPSLEKKLCKAGKAFFGKHYTINSTQIVILRLLPFIHFHLLSFFIYENSESFSSYLRTSMFSIIPATVFYTSLGKALQALSMLSVVFITIVIVMLAFAVRKKQIHIKWDQFFSSQST